MPSRTGRIAVAAATPATTGSAAAPPHRNPAVSAGGRRPSGARVQAQTAVPNPMCGSGCHRDGIRPVTALQPTNTAARMAVRSRSCTTRDRLRIRWPPAPSGCVRCRRRSSPVARRRPPNRRECSRRSCGRGPPGTDSALVMSAATCQNVMIGYHRMDAVRSQPGRLLQPVRSGEQQVLRPPHDRVGSVLQEQHPGALPRRCGVLGDLGGVVALREPHGAPVVVARLHLWGARVAPHREAVPQGAGIGRPHPQHRREAHPGDVGQPAERALARPSTPGSRRRAAAADVGRAAAAPTARGWRRSSSGPTPSTSAGRRGTKSSSADRNTAIPRSRCRRCTSTPARGQRPG